MNARLLGVEPETPTTRRVTLALDGQRFSYLAGQPAALAVADAVPTPYSIASAPSDTDRDGVLEFLVKVDGASRFGAVVATLEPGRHVDVTHLSGTLTFNGGSRDGPLLFVAGGTGIAPLRSILRQALHDGHRGAMALVYSARSPREFAYRRELQALADAGRLALTLTLTGDADDWLHARGRTAAGHLRDLVTENTVCYVCGPRTMVVDVRETLIDLGVTASAIRTEDW